MLMLHAIGTHILAHYYNMCFIGNGRLTSRYTVYEMCCTSNGRLTSRLQYVNIIFAVLVMAG